MLEKLDIRRISNNKIIPLANTVTESLTLKLKKIVNQWRKNLIYTNFVYMHHFRITIVINNGFYETVLK